MALPIAQPIERTYKTEKGTLSAIYAENAKGKMKLTGFTFSRCEPEPKTDVASATAIALSNVWINDYPANPRSWPANQLKGFKSYILPAEAQCKLQGNTFEITLNDPSFQTISLTVKVPGEQEQTLFFSAP